MTPDRARYLIHVYGALEITDLKAPEYLDALETIATMRTEYAVQIPNGELVGVSWSSYGSYETAREHRDAWRRDGYDANIVRRFVTAPQPLEGEDQ